MRTIHKYRIELNDYQTIRLPKGAQILHVGVSRKTDPGSLNLWAIVTPDVQSETRYLRIFGTGHTLPNGSLIHLGTVVMGTYVWHVFEQPDAEYSI